MKNRVYPVGDLGQRRMGRKVGNLELVERAKTAAPVLVLSTFLPARLFGGFTSPTLLLGLEIGTSYHLIFRKARGVYQERPRRG